MLSHTGRVDRENGSDADGSVSHDASAHDRADGEDPPPRGPRRDERKSQRADGMEAGVCTGEKDARPRA